MKGGRRMSSDRYSRQILFSPIGEAGQERLAKSHVLIVGLGALGTQSAESLARAGVGKLTIVDRDYIEYSNLQRQQLYTESDAHLKLPKAVAAEKRLRSINSEIEITSQVVDVTPEELAGLVKGVDLIIDGTDNFDIRMILNDISQKVDVPWIYGSCVGSYGMSFTIIPNQTPCLHCMIGKIPLGGPTCDTAGIIGPTVSQVVAYQTVEALKWLTGNKDALRKSLVTFDVWTNERMDMDVTGMKRVDCPSCGKNPTYPFLTFDKQTKSAVLCGRDAVQIRPAENGERDLAVLAERLEKTRGHVQVNPFLLSYTIGKYRLVLFKDGRALIHGTNDVEQARTLYYRYFGS